MHRLSIFVKLKYFPLYARITFEIHTKSELQSKKAFLKMAMEEGVTPLEND